MTSMRRDAWRHGPLWQGLPQNSILFVAAGGKSECVQKDVLHAQLTVCAHCLRAIQCIGCDPAYCWVKSVAKKVLQSL